MKTAIIAMLFVTAIALPSAAFAAMSADELHEQISAIEKKYGFPETPELTEEQWDAYYTKMQSIDAQRNELFMQLDSLNEQALEIEKEFGFEPWPEHPPEVWDQYNSEVESLYLQLDEHYQGEYEEYDKKLDAIYTKYGFLTSQQVMEAPDEFVQDIDKLHIDTQYMWIGFADPTLDEESKKNLSDALAREFFPEMGEIYKKHGYEFEGLDANQVYELNEEIIELEKSMVLK